jgi:hypothetical protein
MVPFTGLRLSLANASKVFGRPDRIRSSDQPVNNWMRT